MIYTSRYCREFRESLRGKIFLRKAQSNVPQPPIRPGTISGGDWVDLPTVSTFQVAVLPVTLPTRRDMCVKSDLGLPTLDCGRGTRAATEARGLPALEDGMGALAADEL